MLRDAPVRMDKFKENQGEEKIHKFRNLDRYIDHRVLYKDVSGQRLIDSSSCTNNCKKLDEDSIKIDILLY